MKSFLSSSSFSAILLVSHKTFTSGFVVKPRLSVISNEKSSSNQMTLDPASTFTVASIALKSPIQAISVSSSLSLMDPFVEAEIFNDAAHVALDLTQFLGPATLSIRLLAVLGRIFCIASDYLPDHSMLPEEFVFQFSMLALASTALAQSLNSIVHSYGKELTIRDRKCFTTLFHPGGVTLMQYKMMTGTVLEWKEVAPGGIITSDEYEMNDTKHDLYWLYRGDATVQSQGRVLQEVVPKSIYLFGDLGFALTSNRKRVVSDTNSFPKTTTRAGPKGAKVLSINTLKLKDLMSQDELLDRAIRDMLLESMQERIAVLLTNAK